MSKISLHYDYNHIISLENLLKAWKEFARGKRTRKDAQELERDLMTNIIALHRELAAKTYSHSAYQHFKIADPKPRDIHKASVRDRLLHHALHKVLSPFFAKTFITDSNSCQKGNGQIAFLDFFSDAIIGFSVLVKFLQHMVVKILLLTTYRSQTSIYMNEFDQFMKHRLKTKHYIRYSDDFVVLSHNRAYLENILPDMQEFLGQKLKLIMHPNKIFIQTVASGVDFLGWVHFPDHRVLRTTTKKRMFRNIKRKEAKPETVQSYLGLIKHGNGWKLKQKIEDEIPKTDTL